MNQFPQSAANGPQRAALIQLSHQLLDDRLVVRTWGNFSVRPASESAPDHFLITPSGRDYRTMAERDLAEVDLDGSWTGPLKPSSEHPMHAIVYRTHPHVGCVIHTHQPYASALSLWGSDVPLSPQQAERLGQDRLTVAAYGLPGTKKLHRGVSDALARHDGRIVLLTAHGALIFADTPSETRALANELEAVAREIHTARLGGPQGEIPAPAVVRSELIDGSVRFFDDADGERVRPDIPTRQAHERIYRLRTRTRAIVVNTDPDVLACGTRLKPYLDDFAQIAGLVADDSGTRAVTLGPTAALCAGASVEEATNISLVLSKNAKAARIGRAVGHGPIKAWECLLMNRVYALKYSKQAGGSSA